MENIKYRPKKGQVNWDLKIITIVVEERSLYTKNSNSTVYPNPTNKNFNVKFT